MPQDSFFKLEEKKQKKIVDAMKKEFSRVSFHEASVNKIVEDAGISKGSFWVYFESKEEAIQYLIELHLEKERKKAKQIFKKNHGDLFAGYLEIYDYLAKNKPAEKERKLLTNIFEVLIAKNEKCLHNEKTKCEMQEIQKIIDTEKFEQDSDLFILVKILNFSMRSNLMESYREKISEKEARDNFIRTIEILKEGVQMKGGSNVKN